MHLIYSALILDDDPLACAFMKWYLEDRFPYMRVVTANEPRSVRGFSLYFLDNDFEGTQHAIDLVKQIRREDSHSFVAVFSARLDPKAFKALLNAGCDGAFEKGKSGELPELERLIRSYLEAREARAVRIESRGLSGTMNAMANLIGRWSRRLDSSTASTEGSA